MITGHRGAAALAPENTIASINKAAEAGVKWVEIDTQLSADGIPVVIHDETVNRCTDGKGRIADLTLAQLKRLDAGSWFHPSYANERIPTLVEALDACLSLGLTLNLELKVHHDEQIEPLVNSVVALIREKGYPIDKLLFSSFQKKALELCQQLMPEVRRGFICEVWNNFSLSSIQACQAYSVHIDHHILTPAIARNIKNAGYVLKIWTLNNADKAQYFFDMGVDSIITDAPDKF
ncbi:glycerophosphoryl diester phosphodiesterase [Photobacterium gaetbulicola]|uniref:Putative lycerophosphoryl diester phosphodiesterase n=1 Tax=Photobacterium gaetbulicola Gung47 TaxID=658445 RepID=A0A0C5WI08_9GAMM|nr:glycerophosphoryl diester phosphodiesterase [Photobacterium gaetbulicola]AJR05787.1 putative lycerophosphoryl diester phosphodiesterase [Photobacterium gaetbulicola Gung47]PSU14752.1 glycerophosphoryl diester phosphodiesterase [Photobacterium gaetbulicola]